MFNQSVVTLEGRVQEQISSGAFKAVDPGIYDVWAATDTYISVTPIANATAPTSGTGYLVPVGGIVSVRVAKEGMKLGASAATSFFRVE